MKLQIDELGFVGVNVEDWNINRSYRKPTITTDYNAGITYITRKNVPAGIPLTDNEYWKPIVRGNGFTPIPSVIDSTPTKDSPNAVSSGGTFGALQTLNEINATLSEDGKLYNNFFAGDIYYTEQNTGVRVYWVAFFDGEASEENPVTISTLKFYRAENATDAVRMSLSIKTVSTGQQQSLTPKQQVQAQNNIMAKAYAPAQFSGLGKKVLSKNMQTVDGVQKNIMMQTLFQDSQGNDLENTVFVIQYDYILGENITIPEGCVLMFDGGNISSGGNSKDTITGNNLRIDGNDTVLKDMYIVATGSCEIKNLTINYTNAVKDSISITNSTHIDVRNVAINIDDNDYRAYEADGIHIEDSANITIENCTINGTKSNYTDSNQGAIYICDSQNINISRCIANNAKAECLTTQRCSNVNYNSCYIRNCDGSAITTLDDDILRINAVTAIGTGASAISVNSDNVSITNSTFRANALFNAITLGHTNHAVAHAQCIGNIIVTEHNAFGGVLNGDVIISDNDIVCKRAFSFDKATGSVANFTVINNHIAEDSDDSRLSLSGWNIVLRGNYLKNCKLTGYMLDAQIWLENNTLTGYTKNICTLTENPKFLSIQGNYLLGCSFNSFADNAPLFVFDNLTNAIISNNYLYDISTQTQRLVVFRVEHPENVVMIVKSNIIDFKNFGTLVGLNTATPKNNSIVFEDNNVKHENSNGWIYVSDGYTNIAGHGNLDNGQYRLINPDQSEEPKEFLMYNESSFSRLFETSYAKIVRDIDNQNVVQAKACLDFSAGCKILGDVNLNNTRIIPNGCKISDYIQGTITGTYAVGQCLYDETLGKPKWYNGTNWVDASGNVIS